VVFDLIQILVLPLQKIQFETLSLDRIHLLSGLVMLFALCIAPAKKDVR
jgi:hypothetical protein